MFQVIIIILIAIISFSFFVFLKFFLVPKKIAAITELIRKGRNTQAAKVAKAFIASDPRSVDAHYLLGKIYLADNKPELALMELKSINQIGHFSELCQELTFRKEIADLFLRFNQIEEALKEFLLLVKVEPYAADNYYNIGELFEKRGQMDMSINYYLKSIELDKNHSKAHYKVGHIFYKQKKPVEAKVEFELAIKNNPDNYDAYFYLGKLLKESNDYGAALQMFEKASKYPKLKARSLVERGGCYMSMNNYEQSIGELNRAIKASDNDSSLETLYGRYFLAKCYEKIRNLDKAIEQWERIYEKKPSFQDVAEKLSQYQDLRQDDKVKDYITSHKEVFLSICQSIVQASNLEIRDQMEVPNGCQILAAESESKWRNARKMPRLISFLRMTDVINEGTIREFLEEMKKMNVSRGAIYTSSNFSRMALSYAESRPVDLYDKERLKEVLNKIDFSSI